MAVNVATPEQLALLFGLTKRRIRQLTEQGILERLIKPEDGHPIRGHYDLVKSVRAYCQYLRESARLNDPDRSVFWQTRNKKLASEVEIACLKLECTRRKLHRAEDVEFMMGEISSVIRKRLLAIPERVIAHLPGKTTFQEVYGVLYSEVESALRELSQYEPDGQDHLALIAGDNEAAAGPRVPDQPRCQ